MTIMPRAFGAVVTVLRHMVEAATALLFASFTVLIVVQVFYRYVLNDSIFWAEEFSRLAFFGVLMLTMPMVCDRKAHIVMDLLEEMLKPRPKRVLERVNAALMIVFFSLFAWYGAELAGKSWFMMTSATHISMAYIYFLVPLASVLSIVFVINNLLKDSGVKHG